MATTSDLHYDFIMTYATDHMAARHDAFRYVVIDRILKTDGAALRLLFVGQIDFWLV